MTIYDIAEKAGVSVSTVSRVLNGKKNISDSMRARVQKVLDESNYTPSALAQGLANSSVNIIGILSQNISNPHHAKMAYIIEQELAKHGYACLVCSTGSSPEMQSTYLRTMAGRQVDGLILLGSIFQTDLVREEIEKYHPKTPIVMANGYLPLDNVYGVIDDEYNAARECVHHFAKRGHTKIGFILERVTASNNMKKKGFIDGMRECGLECDKSNMLLGVTDSYADGRTATGTLLEKRPDITAILYTVDTIAVGGLKYCHEHGLKVPEDLEIIGFNNSELARVTQPEMSSVDNQLTATGVESARILYDVMHGMARPHKLVLSANLVCRASSPE